MKKAILYINQFFGQIGGEDKADFEPVFVEEKIGSALEFSKNLEADIVGTIICGDNYMGSNTDVAVKKIMYLLPARLFRQEDMEWLVELFVKL